MNRIYRRTLICSILPLLSLTLVSCSIKSLGLKYKKVPPGQVKKRGHPSWMRSNSRHVRYYYFPEIEVYYYADEGRYVYFYKGEWIRGPNLGHQHKGYNLNSAVRIELSSVGHAPHQKHHVNQAKYPPGQAKKGKTKSKIPPGQMKVRR